MMTVDVYTSHEQSEQPLSIYGVTTLIVTDGVLTIECNGRDGFGHHRYPHGRWTHFSVLERS